MANVKRPLENKVYKPQTNESILNGIRKVASNDYKARVPRATQANIEQSMKAIASSRVTNNEFLDALVNLVGDIVYRNKVWTNPLGKFKGPMLEFGDTIEEVATGLIKAHVYDPNNEYMERILFGQHRPDAITSFHRINRQDFYPVTINRDILRRAFYTTYGLSDFVTGLMEAPATSDQWDEFLIIANLLKEYEEAGGYFRVNIPDIVAEPGETSAKAVLRTLRGYARLLPFLSTRYNAAGVPSFANEDELILIATPEFLASIDVDGLAGLFNVEYGEVRYRTVAIPREYMPADIEAILTVDDFFVIRDTLLESTNQPNAVGLTENYFLHHHGIYSLSRFVPAIALTTGAGTEVEIVEPTLTGLAAPVLTDADGNAITVLTRGENAIVTTEVQGTPANLLTGEAVIWTLTGNTDSRTRIYQTGIIHVSSEEVATALTVTAMSATDPSATVSATYNVVGERVQQWPAPEVIPDSDADGLLEVTPEGLALDADDKVTIPTVTGVQYKKAGVNVNNGTVHTVTESTVFTAVARAGYELAAGAVASWTLTP